jgi:hypothetical protein
LASGTARSTPSPRSCLPIADEGRGGAVGNPTVRQPEGPRLPDRVPVSRGSGVLR